MALRVEWHVMQTRGQQLWQLGGFDREFTSSRPLWCSGYSYNNAFSLARVDLAQRFIYTYRKHHRGAVADRSL